MATNKELDKAKFTETVKRKKIGKSISVQFNPASLQFTVTNSIKNQGKGDKKKQYITQRTEKLSVELVFDTTDTGEDIHNYTGKIASFMKGKNNTRSAKALRFEWGTYVFDGMMESYKEVVDFFSGDGVPLRATVTVGLAGKDTTFEPGKSATAGREGLTLKDVERLKEVEAPPAPDRDSTRVASDVGNPRAGNAIAANNGLESPRFPGGATLVVSGALPLKASPAFSSGAAGLSAGASAEVDAGLDLIGSRAFGALIGATATPGFRIGSKTSAGISASAGAFAGLRSGNGTSKSFAQLDVDALLDADEAVGLATDVNASFDVSGQANIHGAASLSTDVGVAGRLQERIEFDEE